MECLNNAIQEFHEKGKAVLDAYWAAYGNGVIHDKNGKLYSFRASIVSWVLKSQVVNNEFVQADEIFNDIKTYLNSILQVLGTMQVKCPVQKL